MKKENKSKKKNSKKIKKRKKEKIKILYDLNIRNNMVLKTRIIATNS